MKHLTTNRPIPIFAGDRYLGFVVQTKKGGHEARDASGACIGVFREPVGAIGRVRRVH